MRALLDVNVLIALFDAFHVNHDRAHEWLNANSSFGWATTPITQNGFVRIVSQPNYPATMPPMEAVRRLKNATSADGHAFWPDDISLLQTEIFDSSQILSPSQITDIYLLGLAFKNKGCFVTFDRKIKVSAIRKAVDRLCIVI